MSPPVQTVVGIDVGAEMKGFHAVALLGQIFVDKRSSTKPAVIAEWCLEHKATVVSVDAPSGWSQTGSSRLAEQKLELLGQKIFCFATPTRDRAAIHTKGFYDWVFNGERLYRLFVNNYPLYKGERQEGPVCIETFPHAIVCFMAGRVVSAKPKAIVRRKALQNRGYDTSNLSSIDYLDAALCAVAADEFRNDHCQSFGNREEGFIIVPALRLG